MIRRRNGAGPVAPRSPVADIGATGLEESWGRIDDDFLKEWNGESKIDNVDEMLRNSPVIAALRLSQEMPIRGLTWNFSSDEEGDDPRVLFLNEAIENMSQSWNDFVVDSLLFPFYGWMQFAIIYKRVNGRLWWRKFKPLGHKTNMQWVMADDGGVAGLKQWPHLYAPMIPIERMLLFRFRKPLNNPEGESILRPAWPPWYYVKNIQQLEGIGIERHLAGLPVITLPEGADTTAGSADMAAASLLVRNVRNDEQGGVTLPPGWVLTLLSSPGSSKVVDTDIVINRYEKRMLMAALAQFLMLGQDGVGSLSLSTDQSDFFNLLVNAVADIFAETFMQYGATRLLELNGWDADGVRLEHSPAGNVDLEKVTNFLQAAADRITWTAEDEMSLREMAQLPERTAEEIEEAREEERARVAAMLPQFAPQTPPQAAQNVDTNAARVDAYAADNAPDDDERRRQEAAWADVMGSYFTKQERRIVKGTREMMG